MRLTKQEPTIQDILRAFRAKKKQDKVPAVRKYRDSANKNNPVSRAQRRREAGSRLAEAMRVSYKQEAEKLLPRSPFISRKRLLAILNTQIIDTPQTTITRWLNSVGSSSANYYPLDAAREFLILGLKYRDSNRGKHRAALLSRSKEAIA